MSGFNHNPLGLLQCPKLRDLLEPTSLLTYDWSHIYLSNGIGGSELAGLLSKLKSAGIGHESLRSETAKWKFPSFLTMRGYCANSLAGMFRDKRASNTVHGHSTSASEFLYVAPTILYFLQVTLGDERRKGLEGPIESFRRLNNVIDIIQAHKHNLLSDPELLAHAIGEHQRLYVALYDNNVLPKHHWSLHLPDQIRREIAASSPTRVLDTFTNERHHQIPKSFGEAKKKLEGFEQCVLFRSISNQTQLISRLSETPQLTRREWHEEAGAHIGVSIQYANLTLSRGEVVIVDGISAKRIAWAGITAPHEHAFLMVENCYRAPLASASIAIKPMGTFTTVWLASVRISLPHGWRNADDGWMHVAINSTCKILAQNIHLYGDRIARYSYFVWRSNRPLLLRSYGDRIATCMAIESPSTSYGDRIALYFVWRSNRHPIRDCHCSSSRQLFVISCRTVVFCKIKPFFVGAKSVRHVSFPQCTILYIYYSTLAKILVVLLRRFMVDMVRRLLAMASGMLVQPMQSMAVRLYCWIDSCWDSAQQLLD